MKNASQIILGLDPGIAKIGYGCICGHQVQDYGVIQTEARTLTAERLLSIRADIHYLCRVLEPDVVAIEYPFFDRTITNAGKVLRALGVIELALGEMGHTEPVFLHQSQVKSVIAQYGADKQEIKEAVQAIFCLPELPRPDDAADGLAIAYAAQLGMRANIC